jgi:hypothetical protein
MAAAPATSTAPSDDAYAEAYDAWRRALGNYLRLAREGAGAAKLRAAAAAVHAAALNKGRIAHGPGDDAP